MISRTRATLRSRNCLFNALMKPQYLAVVIASGPRTILIFGDLIKSPVLWRFVASCISHSLQSEFKNVKAAG